MHTNVQVAVALERIISQSTEVETARLDESELTEIIVATSQ